MLVSPEPVGWWSAVRLVGSIRRPGCCCSLKWAPHHQSRQRRVEREKLSAATSRPPPSAPATPAALLPQPHRHHNTPAQPQPPHHTKLASGQKVSGYKKVIEFKVSLHRQLLSTVLWKADIQPRAEPVEGILQVDTGNGIHQPMVLFKEVL